MPMLRCGKIRNSEYYGMYNRFDELYEQSQKRNVFTHLFEDRSIQYQDNRIALYIAQKGKCAITGEELQIDDIHCHHKTPKCFGGTDVYDNLIIVKKDIHRLIHCTDIERVKTDIARYNLDSEKLKKFNKLRLLAKQESI